MDFSAPASQSAVSVAIVEDDRTMREGLATLIDGATGYRCVGRYGSVEEALRAPRDDAADVMLLDIKLPGVPGTEGVRLLRERNPKTEVLMLSVYADQARVFEAICNGAVGSCSRRHALPACSRPFARPPPAAPLCRQRSPVRW